MSFGIAKTICHLEHHGFHTVGGGTAGEQDAPHFQDDIRGFFDLYFTQF
jgi:hypothetical protein